MLPPLHRIDAPIQFVHEKDDVWDYEKINRELTALAEKGTGEVAEHPIALYRNCQTRYDLEAGVRAYFKEGALPTIFLMDRLSRSDWKRIRDMRASGRFTDANEYAIRKSLRGVTNGDDAVPLLGPGQPHATLTDADMKTLEDRFGREIIEDVGTAAIKASGDLTEREKKQ